MHHKAGGSDDVPRPGVHFPQGMPTISGGAGLYQSRPGSLPVHLVFRDYDILRGLSGVSQFALRGGVVLTLRQDEFVVLPPFVPIAVRAVRPEVAWRYCHFSFRPLPAMRDGDKQHAAMTGPPPDVPMPLWFTAAEAPGVYEAYQRLEAVSPASQGRLWRLEAALITLITEVAAFASQREQQGERCILLAPAEVLDRRIAAIRQRIEADPARPWSVAALADEVGLSPGHLHALCSRCLGMGVKRLIVEARLKRALRMLRTPQQGVLPSIRKVAEACGFSSQHLFSRQFKEHFRMTPLAYRNGVHES